MRHSETHNIERKEFQSPSAYLILWSLLASLPLIGFYMKVPAIASRYMLDFAPAFAAALAGLWCWMMEKVVKREKCQSWTIRFLSIALIGWLGAEIVLARRTNWPPQFLTRQDLMNQVSSQLPLPGHLPHEYKIGDAMEQWNVPFDGEGWNSTSGQVRLCAIFFVENPRFLELELGAAPNCHVTETDLNTIQAKVGFEFLKRTSITRVNGAWIMQFDGPRAHRFQQGLQPVFLAMIPPDEMAEYALRPTPWILKKLSW
jgi:hypothetical protein